MKDILYLFCLILVPFPTLLSPPISFHKAEGNDEMENERKKERERVERERERVTKNRVHFFLGRL